MDEFETKTSWLKIGFAWLFVTVPLGWGVSKSVLNSLPLFQASATAKPAAAPRVSAGPKMPNAGRRLDH